MAIQFNCPGCRQPVEVDDEWAGQHVACPFCQRVVTAPTESTISALQHDLPPTARRLSPTPVTVAPRYNRLAVVGFALSLAAILLLILGLTLLRFVADEMGPNSTFQEQQKKMAELMGDPQFAGRLMLGMGLFILSFVCWLAGLIISVIAAIREDLRGRRISIAGIACAVLCPLLFCFGGALIG